VNLIQQSYLFLTLYYLKNLPSITANQISNTKINTTIHDLKLTLLCKTVICVGMTYVLYTRVNEKLLDSLRNLYFTLHFCIKTNHIPNLIII